MSTEGRILFVPVSGPRGMGEYARALTLATGLSRRSPALELHFALSREAPYTTETPFPKTVLPSSPTFHSEQMVSLIEKLRPTLVVFDNAGRSPQLEAAVRNGSRIIFISSRPRQRRRAFRVRWMRMLDEHWIAYPEFIAGALGPIERLKRTLFGGPVVRYIDVLLPTADEQLQSQVHDRFGVARDRYVLIVPGGGSSHRGAEQAPQVIADAARRIAQHGIKTILVGGPCTRSDGYLTVIPRVPMPELAELMRAAQLIVSNGGDTLVQALAFRRPCLAVPIAPDQAHRIAVCEQAGLAVGTPLDARRIADAVLDWHRPALAANAAVPMISNRMEAAIDALQRLAIRRLS